MDKKAIGLIIGLMSMSLLGIVLMQSYWIRYSINLNEAQFDKNVRIALRDVSQILMNEEVETISRDLFFGDFASMPGKMAYEEEIFYDFKSDPTFNVERTFSQEIPEDSFLLIDKDIFYYHDALDHSCYTPDDLKHIYESFELQMTRMLTYSQPLVERINLNRLDDLIQRELVEKGIDLAYQYGVFSNRRRNFVFVKDSEPSGVKVSGGISKEGLQRLYNSSFKVDLFPFDRPGKLMMFFPRKTSFIWQSVLGMLLASILFTAIILFCFMYTIQVIFKQKKLSEIKTDFINNMTHEFKTPIATISLAADSITSKMVSEDSSKVKRFASIIKEENKRMNSQVEKVLQMALLDKDDFKLNIRAIDVHEVIRQASRHMGLQLEQKSGRIKLDLQANDFEIEGDLTHFSSVIHNLLDNANKYTPEKPEITIRTANVSGGIKVFIKDNGIGMDAEVRKRIFDKFYRVHTGNLHDVKGFGLGLSYVKAIITAHKGHVDVKSELGKGSEFILFFPFQISR